MTNEQLQTNLEFMAKLFSEPNNELMEQIRLGETPLGKVEQKATEFSYADEKLVLLTDIFVNSQNARPAFPLATEHLENRNEKENYIDKLNKYYAKDNKVSTNYPPDHLKVMFEFLLFKFSQDDIVGVKDFYTIYLKPWYNRFTEAILKRSDDPLAVQLVALIDKTLVQIEKL